MSASLVGSEMCIRDSFCFLPPLPTLSIPPPHLARTATQNEPSGAQLRGGCLLYTSDAADDM
eukprot:7728545-Alexandrium_andersonii.AAC.1